MGSCINQPVLGALPSPSSPGLPNIWVEKEVEEQSLFLYPFQGWASNMFTQ